MSDKSKSIIIKKIKKGHEGHHGGAWKVAYADFVTAMMAFFLLMWLLAMVSPEKRAALSEYFKHFSIFEKAGQSFMMEGQQQVLEKGQEMKTFDFSEGKAALSPEDLKEKLKKAIEEKLRALKDQVVVDIYEGGVRIQLVDLEGKSMFQSGSAQLTPSAKEILKLVGDNIKDLPNRIAVEGHTDAAPLKAGRITNWELSTDRASSARRELEANGIEPGRIARVVGYADTELLVKDNPHDPRNRRISIILLQSKIPMPEKPSKAPEIKPEAVQPTPSTLPPPPAQPAKPEPEVKKPAVEKPALKQEQKKDSTKSDIGIKPIKPITPVAPAIGN